MTIWHPLRRLFERKPVGEAWPPPEPQQPTAEPSAKALAPAAAPVHVLSGSALVRVADGVLLIERPGEETHSRPIEHVSAVHIHGWAGITSPTVAALLAQGSPVLWRSASGYPIGYSAPLHTAGLEVREAQLLASQNGQGMPIARQLVSAKIVNMAGLVRRRAPTSLKAAVHTLNHLARKARHARQIDELLGLEGAATAQYFCAWPQLISERAQGLEFLGRSRRPPKDAVNAALSYAYSVLLGEALAAVVAAGLEPRLGFLHARRAGRPALALDLMEPFRPLIADRAVLAGANTGRFEDHLFEERDGGVWLTEAGRRLALSLLEDRLGASLTLPGRDSPCTYREAIGLNARGIASSLADGAPLQLVEQP